MLIPIEHGSIADQDRVSYLLISFTYLETH